MCVAKKNYGAINLFVVREQNQFFVDTFVTLSDPENLCSGLMQAHQHAMHIHGDNRIKIVIYELIFNYIIGNL